ncbi:MAG: quinolinate synthase NadA [Caldilineales bacterium]
MSATLTTVDRTGMTVDEIYEELVAKIGEYTPAFELRVQAELAWEVNQLKRQRNAVILGHNYMEPALFHSVPDFVGDSLDLSRKAAATDKDVIVFCGVKFMAETAKILNPSRTVLLPSLKAGCSLAASITADDVRALKARFPACRWSPTSTPTLTSRPKATSAAPAATRPQWSSRWAPTP